VGWTEAAWEGEVGREAKVSSRERGSHRLRRVGALESRRASLPAEATRLRGRVEVLKVIVGEASDKVTTGARIVPTLAGEGGEKGRLGPGLRRRHASSRFGHKTPPAKFNKDRQLTFRVCTRMLGCYMTRDRTRDVQSHLVSKADRIVE
jgi:hypothetical protein